MSIPQRLSQALKAFRQLGPRQLGLYAWYRLGLRSGLVGLQTRDIRWMPGSPSSPDDLPPYSFRPLLSLPAREEILAPLGEGGLERLLAEADEIAAGQARLFGGELVPLQLNAPGPLRHWTAYEKWEAPGDGADGDIKFTWEPARFGWAFTLGRAYYLSGDERLPGAFWRYAETFLDANPPYRGPHWASAQEVALRLIAFAFALQVFAASPHSTPARTARLAEAIAIHAARIPPTLAYARAQNNNHLPTEAAGLYTAGSLLPDHPSASRWKALGWRWFHQALQSQIAEDGSYVQHSTNYHRLMLQAALWVNALAKGQDEPFPRKTQERLRAATAWLLALLDRPSGQVPNLGPNDGAMILPLAACPFQDYRPVLQAAAAAFQGQRLFEPGPWDEMALWLAASPQASPLAASHPSPYPLPPIPCSPAVLHSPHDGSWAYLRAARFAGRPGHADQLHVDLWWRELNLAKDAGTYLYNAPPPWDNALASSEVHNTITVDGQDQMTRAGRFLYLDWAQAKILDCEGAGDASAGRLVAEHDGYRRLGVSHRRTLECSEKGWIVTDLLSPVGEKGSKPYALHSIRLHWLLPDWPWELAGSRLSVRSPEGWVSLAVSASQPGRDPGRVDLQACLQLVRAGQALHGEGPVPPSWGWASPTYGHKVPALSLSLTIRGPLPLSLTSEWVFPAEAIDPS